MIEEQRICEQCGKSYQTTVKHQKFCSTKCRKYHWLEKKGFKDISSLVKRMDRIEKEWEGISNGLK